jgi:hypothetical protein
MLTMRPIAAVPFLIRRGIFQKFSLQRASMDAKELCGLSNVSRAIGQDALDMLPFHARKRRDRSWSMFFSEADIQISVCTEYLLGVGGLAEVVIRPQLQCVHCRRNTSVSSQYNDCDRRIQFLDALNEIEAAGARHFEIQQDKIWTDGARQVNGFLRGCFMGLASAIPKRAAEPRAKYFVVVDDKDYQKLG